MSLPFVSIVLPVRNAHATVAETIDSCLEQTYAGDLELVIVDHHSTDGTKDILSGAAKSDERVRVIAPPDHASFIDVVNLAWQESNGELIARIDADDVANLRRIEKQSAFLMEQPDIAACGSLVRIQQRTRHDGLDGAFQIEPAAAGYREYEAWLNSVVTPEQILSERFVDSPLANPSTLVRREVMEQMDGYADPPWAEDYDLWLRMLDAGLRLGKVDEVLLDWFDSPNRTTRVNDRYSLVNFRRCKAHYLAKIPRIQEQGVAICGAGPIGKLIGRELIERYQCDVHAYFEVNPRRIGERINGAAVLDSRDITSFRAEQSEVVLLGAVGQFRARERVRELALAASYVEGNDFFCVA